MWGLYSCSDGVFVRYVCFTDEVLRQLEDPKVNKEMKLIAFFPDRACATKVMEMMNIAIW